VRVSPASPARITIKKISQGVSTRSGGAGQIDTWNDNPRPFVWTKTADQILDSIARYCEQINESRH
jgi:hypothetical protein